MLFVGLGSRILPTAVLGAALPDSSSSLKVAFLLNIAIILFGWRRSKDLRQALDAYDEAERIAHRNANTDPTTSLANRRELMRSLAETLDAKSSGVLILLDLDHFKRVNDLHGHLAGDKMLRYVADAITNSATDAACCARIGGDEFAILLENANAAAGEEVANSILSQLATPLTVGGANIQASASIGLAHIDRLQSEEDVLRQSDVALYAAKSAGRNGFAWFDKQLEQELTERLKLEEDIRNGLENGEFVPFFQPLIDLTSRELVGFEALARWRSPTRGFMEAEGFIEAAERTGLIAPLTMTIMEQALSEARDWPAHLKIAVNVSPVQFRDRTLAEQVMKLLAKIGFPSHRLEVEITEASLLEDRDQVLTIIQSLKNVGVTISLDDFGTGYASMSQLQSLPFDRIKIDKSFVTSLLSDTQSDAIVSTILALGRALQLPITAEGIEDKGTRDRLCGLGCSDGQGWLFGKAMSGETVRESLKIDDQPDVPPSVEQPPTARNERRDHRRRAAGGKRAR